MPLFHIPVLGSKLKIQNLNFLQDTLVVVRACEAAIILVSLPSMTTDCCALEESQQMFCRKLGEHVGELCRAIPEDMDSGDIDDCAVSWG